MDILADSPQDAQSRRYLEWRDREGMKPEDPIQIQTYLKLAQRGRILELLRHVSGTAIDIGCSWGFTTASLNADVGMDINPACIAIAKQLDRDRLYLVGDILNPPTLPKFDTVLLCDILEHLSFPEEVDLAVTNAMAIALDRVVISFPSIGTEDATCFKHQWLADNAHVYHIRNLFRQSAVHTSPGFIYIVGRI